jgi:hypothetical protein
MQKAIALMNSEERMALLASQAPELDRPGGPRFTAAVQLIVLCFEVDLELRERFAELRPVGAEEIDAWPPECQELASLFIGEA